MEKQQQRDIELIEKYFALETSEKELEEFDLKYSKDANFRAKVDRYELANEGVEQKYWASGKRLVNEKKRELELLRRKNKRTLFPFWGLSIAAGLLLLLGAIFWLFPSGDKDQIALLESVNKMAHSTTNLDPLAISIRSGESTKNELWDAYQAEEWQQVLTMTKGAATTTPRQLLIGIAHFQLAQYTEAEKAFRAALKSPAGMEDNILWWLCNAHLQQNQREQAASALQQIISKNYPSASQAQEMMQAIHK